MMLTEEARHRYALHPEFHAQVEMVVQMIQAEHSVRFDPHDLSLVIEAAACATILAHRQSTESETSKIDRKGAR